MLNSVIKIEGISKSYRLGKLERPDTLGEQVKNVLTYPIKNFKRIAGLSDHSKFQTNLLWALNDVSLEIAEGEVLGIIGHNGAGKSTLLKILSRITEPTAGAITINGRVSSLLEVGTGFHPELTGRDNVFMNGTLLGMRRREIQEKFDEIVSFSGVERHIDTPVKYYSSGMTVRLAFSVAAHLEPEILIIDEVLAVGDASFQQKCLSKMEGVAGEGRTVLFVSHNMAAVRSLCSKAVLLEQGEIKSLGAPQDVISDYLEGNDFGSASKRKFSGQYKTGDFELQGIEVANGYKGESGVNMDQSFEILIDYLKKVSEPRIDFTLRFKGSDGNYLFVISSADQERSVVQNDKRRASVVIPANFFNTGDFFLDLLVVEEKSRVVFMINDVIMFRVNPKRVEQGHWMGTTKGYLRPVFEWAE